jgi:hypothetical protein
MLQPFMPRTGITDTANVQFLAPCILGFNGCTVKVVRFLLGFPPAMPN